MAVYPMPICGLSEGSTRESIDAIQLQRTTAGTLRGRSFWTTPKHRYTLRHASCSVAEADALETSYNDNRAANSMTFVWKESGATITARWISFRRDPIGKFRVQFISAMETV